MNDITRSLEDKYLAATAVNSDAHEILRRTQLLCDKLEAEEVLAWHRYQEAIFAQKLAKKREGQHG